jgi:hypothetical protein
MHLWLKNLCEVLCTLVEDRTVSNANRTHLATVPGYVTTQYPTQLGPLGAPTFNQAVPIACQTT